MKVRLLLLIGATIGRECNASCPHVARFILLLSLSSGVALMLQPAHPIRDPPLPLLLLCVEAAPSHAPSPHPPLCISVRPGDTDAAARAGRIARAGARVGRLLRLLRVVRVIKILFLSARGRYGQADAYQSSALGKELKSRISKITIVFILSLLIGDALLKVRWRTAATQLASWRPNSLPLPASRPGSRQSHRLCQPPAPPTPLLPYATQPPFFSDLASPLSPIPFYSLTPPQPALSPTPSPAALAPPPGGLREGGDRLLARDGPGPAVPLL
jgi:hypothetical protein